jgi:mono/diheme cytochrome c family protein
MFCHGPNKQGNSPLYPPLKDLKKTDTEGRDQIVNGKGIMPAFGQLGEH